MSGYGDFAYFYDSLMDDADYAARAEYLLSLFGKYDKVPTLLLDLACGTGNIGGRFLQKGIDVIGADCSEDMLSVAREKYPEMLLLCQDAAELELYGTVDGAVCCLDSLNHITDYEKFAKAIARTALFLEPGRLFIFDLNTPYKHSHVLGDNTIIKEYEDLFCVWQNSTADNITNIELDIFALASDGAWERCHESITERAYTEPEVQKAIDDAGLETVAVLGDMSFDSPAEDSQRIIYVTKRKEA